MNNDVIELAKEIKKSAIEVKNEKFDFVWLISQVKEDWGNDAVSRYFQLLSNYHLIIKICEAMEKLADYENMEPVAYKIIDEKFNEILGFRSSKEGAEQSFLYYKDICCCKVISLYRHPSK
ncbi:hypothetical protein FE394_16835 [Xenorhabdus sp. Reich]|uniref:Uncharacterized protein n=1 Tax=Xenorhabdus littoralis TaxID=2582835 RepID=A0ABU4SQ69_9GAMM|nr:hypothetical protein [Xenorhabdus sp. Reich]MDX8000806.1 hypothetical protein [Xenorhabdus sp. Reich]